MHVQVEDKLTHTLLKMHFVYTITVNGKELTGKTLNIKEILKTKKMAVVKIVAVSKTSRLHYRAERTITYTKEEANGE